MSDEESPPKKKQGFFKRLITAPSRWSLAMWAAMVLGLFLFVLVVTMWFLFFLDPNHVPWRHSMTWWRITIVLVLMFVTPYVFYRSLKLWLEGDVVRYPDVERAWREGVAAMKRHDISVDSTPVFLILGVPNDRLESTLMEASGIALTAPKSPEGSAPLHWYANADAIYIVCSDVGWLAALHKQVGKRSVEMSMPPEGGASPVLSDS